MTPTSRRTAHSRLLRAISRLSSRSQAHTSRPRRAGRVSRSWRTRAKALERPPPLWWRGVRIGGGGCRSLARVKEEGRASVGRIVGEGGVGRRSPRAWLREASSHRRRLTESRGKGVGPFVCCPSLALAVVLGSAVLANEGQAPNAELVSIQRLDVASSARFEDVDLARRHSDYDPLVVESHARDDSIVGAHLRREKATRTAKPSRFGEIGALEVRLVREGLFD